MRVERLIRDSNSPEADVYANGLRNVLLAADLQTGSYRYGILNGLGRTVAGSW